MGYLTLISTNPNFSKIIVKNPARGMQAKIVGNGTAFGFYNKESEQEYIVYFKENDNKKPTFGDTNYLNPEQYGTARLYLKLINEYLETPVKKKSIDDKPGYHHEIRIPLIEYNSSLLRNFKKYCTDYVIDIEEIKDHMDNNISNFYSVNISCDTTIHDLMNFAIIFLGYKILTDTSSDYKTDEFAIKIVNGIVDMNMCYYMRYYLSSRGLSPKQFSLCKSKLEMIKGHDVKLFWGSTHVQRKQALTSLFDFKYPIIDIGCGEGVYMKDFAKKLKDLDYYAVDADKECLEECRKIIEKKELTNVILHDSVDSLLEDIKTKSDTYDIILTEMIEHNTKEDAMMILSGLFKFLAEKTCSFNTIIITTPNKEFNIYYEMKSEFRHDDHKWEPTREEFKDFINESTKDMHVKKDFINIGDEIDGVSVTQCCVIRR